MDLFFRVKFESVSVLQTVFVSHNTRLYVIPTAYTNIKTTVKITKSKADIFKVLGSVPHSEVRGPGLVSRPCTCRFFTFHDALEV